MIPILACVQPSPFPQKKTGRTVSSPDFFLREGGRLYTGYPIRHHGRKLLPVDSKISCISYLGTSFSFSEEAGPLGLHRESRPLLVRNDRRVGDGVLAAVRLEDWWSHRKAACASRALPSGCFLTRRSETGTYITYFYIDTYIHNIHCNSKLRGVKIVRVASLADIFEEDFEYLVLVIREKGQGATCNFNAFIKSSY